MSDEIARAKRRHALANWSAADTAWAVAKARSYIEMVCDHGEGRSFHDLFDGLPAAIRADTLRMCAAIVQDDEDDADYRAEQEEERALAVVFNALCLPFEGPQFTRLRRAGSGQPFVEEGHAHWIYPAAVRLASSKIHWVTHAEADFGRTSCGIRFSPGVRYVAGAASRSTRGLCKSCAKSWTGSRLMGSILVDGEIPLGAKEAVNISA